MYKEVYECLDYCIDNRLQLCDQSNTSMVNYITITKQTLF